MGWETTVDIDHKNGKYFWVGAKKEEYRITATLLEDEAYIVRIANLYKAKYDGWYAAIVE
jgi:hypothetical protein